MRRRIYSALALCLLVAACSTPKPQNSKEYFEQGESMFRDGAYGLAIDRYREMIDQHPFTDQTEEAELRIAHAHYLNEAYIEAVAAFTDFQRRHPTSPYLPFVGYELGMSYKQQLGTIDRDQTAARNADAYFSAVIAQYPESPYAVLSREELQECRDNQAEHELYIARYYLRKGNFPAVENRALEVVGRFPQSSAADQALFALARLYEESDDTRRAALAYSALLQDHPGSALAPQAQAALDRLQTQPADVGPAARQALLAAANYTPARRDAGAPIEVPGIVKDSGTYAPPSGIGIPAPGTGSGPGGIGAPRTGRGF